VTELVGRPGTGVINTQHSRCVTLYTVISFKFPKNTDVNSAVS
jgi:hypothetical protein